MLLQVEELTAAYGLKKVLFDVSLNVEENEIVAVIGPNGAGKTTLLRAIFGIHRRREGKIIFQDQNVSLNGSYRNLISGMSYVPQGGRVFGSLTVYENLIMGAYLIKDRNQKGEKLEVLYSLFPILRERRGQLANTLSGGERQMLVIGMSMMLTPKLLLLDEPSIGLAPGIVPRLMGAIKKINEDFGTSVLIVEQNARQVLKISERVYVIKVGKITDVDRPDRFLSKEELRKVYLSEAQ